MTSRRCIKLINRYILDRREVLASLIIDLLAWYFVVKISVEHVNLTSGFYGTASGKPRPGSACITVIPDGDR